jgi:chitinase
LSYLVVGFLPGYATNVQRGYDIANVPGDDLTHLIYCFGGFVQNGNAWEAATPEPKDETKNFVKLQALKQKFPALSFMVSVGGWDNSQKTVSTNGPVIFSAIAADPALRQTFVKSCLDKFIDRSPALFDGIDIDWEFPEPQDNSNFTLLVQEFRAQLDALGVQLGRHLTLTMSSGIAAGNVDLLTVQSLLDWINVMSYDLHLPNNTPSNSVTNFNTPLFSPPEDPTPGLNIDSAIRNLIALGVTPAKLLLGIPAFAHSYSGVDSTNGGAYQPFAGPGPGTYTPDSGILSYKDIVENYLPTYGPPAWNDTAKASSLYSAPDRLWISTNLDQDVFAKVAYVVDKGLGGLMLWELGSDTINPPSLVGYINAALPG